MQHTLLGQHRRVLFLVDLKVFLLDQPRDDAVDGVVLVDALFRRTADDQRRARFVDQDRVDLVDDGVDRIALHHRLEIELHVVAQVVETELVVGPVRDVATIGLLPLAIAVRVLDHADGQAQEFVEAAHPLGVAPRQVVVHRHDVDAASAERVQINSQRGDERLSLAGLHLRDFPVVQDHAAHELDVEVPHVQRPLRSFTADRECLGKKIVQRFLQIRLRGFDGVFVARNFLLRRIQRFHDRTQALAKLRRLSAQLVVGEFRGFGLERIDLRDHRKHALHIALVLRPENRSQYFVDHDFSFA